MEQYTTHIYTKEFTLLVFCLWIRTTKLRTIKILVTILPNRSNLHNFLCKNCTIITKTKYYTNIKHKITNTNQICIPTYVFENSKKKKKRNLCSSRFQLLVFIFFCNQFKYSVYKSLHWHSDTLLFNLR